MDCTHVDVEWRVGFEGREAFRERLHFDRVAHDLHDVRRVKRVQPEVVGHPSLDEHFLPSNVAELRPQIVQFDGKRRRCLNL